MGIPTKEPLLLDRELEIRQQAPLAKLEPAAELAFERLAKDPSVDVEKLERLIAMHERLLSRQARADFEAAFAEMQGELPAIDEKGRIVVGETVRSRYARYEDIQAAIRPVLKRFGFALRHREEDLPDGKLRIVGILSHRGGHREEDKFDCPPDTSGGKSNIQAIGSTRSYGMRYTTISLLNIETRGMDTDGQPAPAPKAETAAPAGYGEWLADMEATADEGWPALSKAFSASKREFARHVTGPDRAKWAQLRQKAERVGK